jgi:hypothetical protein
MSAAEITAICTGVPAIIAAVTALIYAIRGSSVATATRAALLAHTSDDNDHTRGGM